MTVLEELPYDVTPRVRDSCGCLHVQRAARALARRFDDALRPVGLTHGQFSLMMSLNRPQPPRIGEVSAVLAMDRTTLTANLKPLERRGLVTVTVDDADRRGRRLSINPEGRDLLVTAMPIWNRVQAEIEALIVHFDAEALRADQRAASFSLARPATPCPRAFN